MGSITESHKNSLRGGLLIAEKRLRHIKEELETRRRIKSKNTIMYVTRDNINATTKSRAVKIINSMLKEIEETRDVLDLDIAEESLGRRIFGPLSEIYVTLEELTPRQLNAYGKVSQYEKELIEPHINRLLAKFDGMEALLSYKPGKKGRP